MNPLLIELVKFVLEKALIEAGKEADWAAIKKDAMDKIDQLLPSRIFDAVARYLCGLLLDVVASYFTSASVPLTPDSVHAAVESASQSLLGRVAMDFLSKA